MRYINTKTQAVIETACKLKGGNWVKADEQLKNAKTPVKATRKKRGE